MAALTDERATKSRNLGAKRKYLMADNITLYAGGMCMIDADGKAADPTQLLNNNGIVGVVTKTVTNPASGSEEVEVQEGDFLLACTSIAQANVGEAMYGYDSETVDEAAGTNQPRAGVLVEFVSSTSGWIHLGVAVAS